LERLGPRADGGPGLFRRQPVIVHDKAGNVLQVLRASLTNTPNLTGLTALQSEEIGMDWRAKLLALLGLDSSADDAAIEAALTAKMNGGQKEMCSEDVARHPMFTALQSQVTDLAGVINTLQTNGRQTAAEQFVDAAIKAGRVGVAPARAEYIAMHSANPAATEALIGKLPILNGALPARDQQQDGDGGNGALTHDDRTVMALFGVDEETYKAELAKGGQKKEIL
jgi:phage I-like protein